MSYSERAFAWFWRRVRGGDGAGAASDGPPLTELTAWRASLGWVATAIAGRPIAVRLTDEVGGVGGDALWIPTMWAARRWAPHGVTVREVIGVRVALGALLQRWQLARHAASPTARAIALWGLARARRRAAAELPGLWPVLDVLDHVVLDDHPSRGEAGAWTQLVRHALGDPAGLEPDLARWLEGDVPTPPAALAAPLIAGGAAAPALPHLGWLCVDPPAPTAGEPGASAGARGGQERAGRARPQVRHRELAARPAEENPLIHSFEKVHTLEKYGGGRKQVDGADELDAHGDALDELDLDEVVRSSVATSGVYRADGTEFDASPVQTEAAPVASGLRYDEWDERAGAYRRGWCAVHLEEAPPTATASATAAIVAAARAEHGAVAAALAREVARLQLTPTWLRGRLDGPEVDLDAVVDRQAAIAAGHSGADRLYIARPRRPAELAVVLLLDHSLSSDAWIANRRVLDVATSAVVALSDALAAAHARTAILGFCSNTRHDCRVRTIKEVDEGWPLAYARLAAIEPTGYTRIGPALRHATQVALAAGGRRRLVVLISDGRATDYDAYEGRHGVADVCRAVAEATAQEVACHCVALDARSTGHLAQMFGAGGYALVRSPRELVEGLAQLYMRRGVR